MSSHRDSGRKRGKACGSLLAAVFRILGTCLLALLVAACIPLTLPRLFNYHIYSVISGSMEPALPVGSLVYIKVMKAEEMQSGDIIAYYGARDQASIITHRVVENRVVMGEFITKGDANKAEDMNPIPYGNYIGKVVRSIPHMGMAAELFTSREGKMAAGGVIAAALLLQLLATLADRKPSDAEL